PRFQFRDGKMPLSAMMKVTVRYGCKSETGWLLPATAMLPGAICALDAPCAYTGSCPSTAAMNVPAGLRLLAAALDALSPWVCAGNCCEVSVVDCTPPTSPST